MSLGTRLAGPRPTRGLRARDHAPNGSTPGGEPAGEPGGEPGGARPQRRAAELRTRRRRWWLTFGLLFVLSAAWALATPLMAPPDEAAHTIKAAAVIRGQFFGVPAKPTKYGASPYVTVKVPKAFAQTRNIQACYVLKYKVSAHCAPPVRASSSVVKVQTSAGRYPPLYYLLVGLPALFFSSATGIYLMRLLSALLCCAFLASALDSAASARRSRVLIFGVAVAVTPMVLFLSATVNPNSPEIATAVCLWVSGLVVATDTRGAPSRRLLTRVGLSAAVLVQMRGLSMLWLGLILLSVLAVSSATSLKAVVRDRAARVWGAIVAASTAFAVWWLVRYDPLALIRAYPPRPHTATTGLFRANIGFVDQMIREMIGFVGDTNAPALTFYAWVALLVVALAAALAIGRKRVSIVLAFVFLATIFVPILAEVNQADKVGYIWQGRYTLPLAVGVPILAAFSLPLSQRTLKVSRRAALAVGSTIVLGQGAMFLVALRRYSEGMSGPVIPFSGNWHPPLGAVTVTVVFLLALVAYAAWLARVARATVPSVAMAEAPAIEARPRPRAAPTTRRAVTAPVAAVLRLWRRPSPRPALRPALSVPTPISAAGGTRRPPSRRPPVTPAPAGLGPLAATKRREWALPVVEPASTTPTPRTEPVPAARTEPTPATPAAARAEPTPATPTARKEPAAAQPAAAVHALPAPAPAEGVEPRRVESRPAASEPTRRAAPAMREPARRQGAKRQPLRRQLARRGTQEPQAPSPGPPAIPPLPAPPSQRPSPPKPAPQPEPVPQVAAKLEPMVVEPTRPDQIRPGPPQRTERPERVPAEPVRPVPFPREVPRPAPVTAEPALPVATPRPEPQAPTPRVAPTPRPERVAQVAARPEPAVVQSAVREPPAQDQSAAQVSRLRPPPSERRPRLPSLKDAETIRNDVLGSIEAMMSWSSSPPEDQP